MAGDNLIAALDVGKTHTRLSLIDPEGVEVCSARRRNARVQTPLGWQLDIGGIETWLIETFKNAPGTQRIKAVVPVAHGAAAVLIGRDGGILAAPDYEEVRFEQVNDAYEEKRDPFEVTYSPSLPLGLNLGRQLFYLQQYEPALFSKVAHVLPYPQFWAWRLSGVMANEATSMGCHSDLWQPHSQCFSALARDLGWSELFAPLRFAGEVLGPATGPLGRAAHLQSDCRVLCGIHDSNASYLRHLIGRRDEPFAVISSGTWTVVMAHAAPLNALRAEADMLANVDVFGEPAPTARFMGGREYEAIARCTAEPSLAALNGLIRQQTMALPSFAPAGPFSGRTGRLVNAAGLDEVDRATLAVLYLALMVDLSLESLGATGNIIVDGPLASNALFGPVLAALQGKERIWLDEGRGAAQAIGYLAGVSQNGRQPLRAVDRMELENLSSYKRQWHGALARG